MLLSLNLFQNRSEIPQLVKLASDNNIREPEPKMILIK